MLRVCMGWGAFARDKLLCQQRSGLAGLHLLQFGDASDYFRHGHTFNSGSIAAYWAVEPNHVEMARRL
jgi:hypothetical protein